MKWWLLALVVGCAKPQSTVCSDGRTCPEETVCDDIHTLCLPTDRATVCGSLENGDRCAGEDRPGVCDQGFCIAACGDGIKDQIEECDDGNFASNDGCSSSCALEARSWELQPSPWQGRTGHQMSYDSFRGRIVVYAGTDPAGGTAPLYEYDTAAQRWERMPTTPPLVGAPLLAFDSTRNVHVLFGTNGAQYETWEYDGTTWTQKQPATSPPLRTQAAMAYDVGRQTMVMFGGIQSGTTLLTDTWEWNGTNWVELTTSTLEPTARTQPSMAYDPSRGAMVLTAGAYYCSTWELAAGQWTLKVPASPSAPSPTNQNACRYAASFAYSAARGKLVLFGGYDNFNYFNDTWEYGATGWTRLAPTLAPNARSAARLAPGGPGGSLVLVGGHANDEIYDDLWQLTGGEWSLSSPDVIPSPRASAFVYDEARDRVILFGGDGAPLETLRDTWSFDDGEWVRLANGATGDPPGARSSAMTYDSARDRVVMFGGLNNNETWEWNGTSWSKVTTATSPPFRRFAAMTYDRARSVVVMFGGIGAENTQIADTWEYDGVDWSPVVAATSPPAQARPSMVFDRNENRTLMFDANNVTWAYADRAWTQLAPSTKPSGRSTADLFWDPMRSRVAFYRGTSADVPRADLWEWDGATWNEVVIEGEPPPTRQPHRLVGLPQERVLMLFGGRRTAASNLNDTWNLRYRSRSPVEDCGNGADDDGDYQVDGVDPDCQ